MLQQDMGTVTMKASSDGKLIDRRSPRRADPRTPEKLVEDIELTPENPEELHQTQALIQDLDKHFSILRETLQERHTRITQVRQELSDLQTLLFPPRHRWWRRWLPW
jgi:chromosome segregation ATPase